ncbi:hypothetical protein [Stenotrophomonas phage CM2]
MDVRTTSSWNAVAGTDATKNAQRLRFRLADHLSCLLEPVTFNCAASMPGRPSASSSDGLASLVPKVALCDQFADPGNVAHDESERPGHHCSFVTTGLTWLSATAKEARHTPATSGWRGCQSWRTVSLSGSSAKSCHRRTVPSL